MDSSWLTGILPGLIGIILVVAPYAAEKRLPGKSPGVFGLLFWLFLAQCLAIAVSVAVLELLGMTGPFADVLMAVGGIAFMTIGIVPFVLVPLAVLVAIGVLGVRWYANRDEGTAAPRPGTEKSPDMT